MAQFINFSDPNARLGAQLGTGIGEGLSALAEHKLQGLIKARKAKSTATGLRAIFSEDQYSNEKIHNIANLLAEDPEAGREVLKDILKGTREKDFAKSFAENIGLGQTEEPGKTPGLPQGEEQIAAEQQAMANQQQAVTAPEELSKIGQEAAAEQQVASKEINKVAEQVAAAEKKVTPEELNKAAQQAPVEQKIAEQVTKAAQKAKQEPVLQNLQSAVKKLIQGGYPLPKNQKEANELYKEAHKAVIEENKLALKERQLGREDQREIDKETLPIYQAVVKEGKVAAHDDKILDRIDTLLEKGDLGNPIINSLLDTGSLAIDLNSLKTADAQELDKLSVEFLKGAKEIFGARITDLDVKTFLKSIPNSAQSKEGMNRVITNMRIANAAKKLRPEAMTEIIAENDGQRPRDLEIQIEKRITPELDRLSAEFRANAQAMELEAEKNPKAKKSNAQGKKYWELF
jgi:hypothetical protein